MTQPQLPAVRTSDMHTARDFIEHLARLHPEDLADRAESLGLASDAFHAPWLLAFTARIEFPGAPTTVGLGTVPGRVRATATSLSGVPSVGRRAGLTASPTCLATALSSTGGQGAAQLRVPISRGPPVIPAIPHPYPHPHPLPLGVPSAGTPG